jgi:hypothetical protein
MAKPPTRRLELRIHPELFGLLERKAESRQQSMNVVTHEIIATALGRPDLREPPHLPMGRPLKAKRKQARNKSQRVTKQAMD